MQIEEIAARFARGEVGVLPTETVYGVGALPTHPEAVRRIFALKDRAAGMNLPVIIGRVDQLSPLGVDVNDVAQRLIDAFWPGPLTLVFGYHTGERAPWLEGRAEVAIRLPGHALLREVAALSGPLLLTSANRAGAPTALDADAAASSMLGPPDFVVDGGTLTPVPSTIVNTRTNPWVIERQGAVPRRAIEEALAR